MKCVDDWAMKEDHPIPLRFIISNMKDCGHKSFTVVNAINSLLKKGYIRRAVNLSNTTSFVQLRRV